jgi:hypothetical protein
MGSRNLRWGEIVVQVNRLHESNPGNQQDHAQRENPP